MSKVVFIKAHAGKQKDTQKPYNVVSIALIRDDGETRTYDLFTDQGALLSNQDRLRFGDVVKPTYKDADYPGGRQSLIGLEVLQSSPYYLS